MENREGGGWEAPDRLGQSRLRQTYTQSGEMENREGGPRQTGSVQTQTDLHTEWRDGEQGGRGQGGFKIRQTQIPHPNTGDRGATTGTCSPTSQPTHTFKRALEDLDRQGVSELH